MAEYIEREAVVDTIYAAFKKYWAIPCSSVDLAVQRDVVHTKNKIYNIPAADVAPVVHGKWTEKDNSMYDLYMRENIHWSTYICSACNGEVMKDFRYCPNCGARMDGDGNG